MENKTCLICKKTLSTNRKKVCSEKCQRVLSWQNRKQKIHQMEDKERKELYKRFYNDKKHVVTSYCVECGETFNHVKVHKRKFCSVSCAVKNRHKMQKAENTKPNIGLKEWRIFWKYAIPKMMKAHYNPKASAPELPKDPFELATYKICELKFNTETFPNKRSEQEYYYFGKI